MSSDLEQEIQKKVQALPEAKQQHVLTLSHPRILVQPQTRESFVAGLNFYQQRLDKGYSVTDCISILAMRVRNITDVLTHDHHFRQEGFTVLL